MSPPSPLAAVAAAFAVVCLALPGPPAWPVWLSCAVLSTLLTVPLSQLRPFRLGLWFVVLPVAAAILYQTGELERQIWERFPGITLSSLKVAVRGLTLLGLLALLPLRGRWRAIPIGAFLLLLAAFFALSLHQLRRGPPDIDVYEMHVEALARFWAGESPYGGSFRNIYPHTDWYGPGLVVDGRVQIGYAYPPLSFLFAVLGDWLGDFRLGFLVATVAAAGLFAAIGGPAGRAGGVLFLLYSRHFWVLHQSWTEPVFVMALAGVLYTSVRRPAALPVALGLFWASKQYAALLLPLVPFLLPAASWREVGRALLLSFAVAAVLFVPFFLWHPTGFLRSVVMYQIWQPFRYDSMGFLSWWVRLGHAPPGNGVTFSALLVGLGVAIWLAPRSAAGFCAGSALALLLFFAFAKQAFMNYYYCCVGILAGLVATSLGGRRG